MIYLEYNRLIIDLNILLNKQTRKGSMDGNGITILFRRKKNILQLFIFSLFFFLLVDDLLF